MSHEMGKGKERRRSQLNGNTTGQTRAQTMKQNNGQYDYEFGQGQGSNMGKKETREKNIQNPMTPNGNKVNKSPYKNKYQYEFSSEPVAGAGQRITNRRTNQKISDQANLKTDRYDLEFGEDSSLKGTGMVPQRNTTTQNVNNKADLKTDRYDYEFATDSSLRGTGQKARRQGTMTNSKTEEGSRARQRQNITTSADQYKYEFGTGGSDLQQIARQTKQNYKQAENQFNQTHNNYNEEFGAGNKNASKYQTSTANYDAANRYKEEYGRETLAQGYGQSSGYMQKQNRGLMKSSLPRNNYNEEFGQDSNGARTNQNLANRKSKVRTPAYGESYNYDQISSTYKRSEARPSYNVEFGRDNNTVNDKGISKKANEMANRYTEEYGLEGPEANPRTLKEKMQSDEYVGKSQRGLYNTNKKYKAEFADASPHSMFTAGKQVAAEKFKQKFQDNLQQNYNVEIAKENIIKKDDNDEK
ncbi:hypothetical protein [Haloplasma contractile]|uniref:Uncharacterized protein n=1 Tax=Haloplasma contractile SSD-17B TaxID=1033810 RepID=U2EGJ2_9MOLU|nr:hypothetical protein [Haloplasma contractile]ERJ13731.1 hypothetical protein HLPCO_000397 [Haloplasma contractile SSD-17B]